MSFGNATADGYQRAYFWSEGSEGWVLCWSLGSQWSKNWAFGGTQRIQFRAELINAFLGCVLVYSALFGVGEILLRSAPFGVGLLVISALAASAIARNLARESATRADLSS